MTAENRTKETGTYAGLTRRAVNAATPIFDSTSTRTQRVGGAVKTAGVVAGATAVGAGSIDGVIELGRVNPLAHQLFGYLGAAPVAVGITAVVVGTLVTTGVTVSAGAGDLDPEERAGVVSVIRRITAGSYIAATSLGLLGGAADLAGSAQVPGMGITGHILVDTAASVLTIGATSHVMSRMLRVGLPKPKAPDKALQE